MFSPPHQFGFLLITLLLSQATSTPFQINNLIDRTLKEKEISTITFFGRIFDMESVLAETNSNIPRMVYTESYGDLYFGGSFNKNILLVARINLWQRAMLNRIDIAFHGIQSASWSIYLISSDRYKNLRYLSEHFEWCWAKGFVNVLVIFTATNETFSYTRFPEMRIFRCNLLEEQLFPDRLDNLMGYSIRTPLQLDPPRVFSFVDSSGRQRVTGYCADIFLSFLKRHNATVNVVRANNSTDYDIPAIVQLIRKGLVDISIHTYMNFDGIRSSYPIRMVKWCVMVPFRGEIRAYWYFIRPFQFYLWLSCLATLISISFYVSLEERLRGTKYDFGWSYCEVFRFMLCLPISDCRPFVFHRALRRAFLFMLGFMLTNLYLAYLTSFLTKVIFKPQIEALDELVTNNISILTRDFEIPLVLRNKGLPAGFDRLLVSTSIKDMKKYEMTVMNGRLACMITDDKALFVLRQQIHLRLPLFKVVDECLSTIPIGFLMAKHSPFEGILNRFILRINSAGLLLKWWSDTYSNGMRAGILKVLPSDELQGPPLTMEHFQFAWLALACGLGMAMICAVVEKFAEVVCKFKVVVVYH